MRTSALEVILDLKLLYIVVVVENEESNSVDDKPNSEKLEGGCSVGHAT